MTKTFTCPKLAEKAKYRLLARWGLDACTLYWNDAMKAFVDLKVRVKPGQPTHPTFKRAWDKV